MLVLARKVGERIYIGDDVVLEVISIDRGKVRLGVVAPREKLVLCTELLNRPVDKPALKIPDPTK